MSYNKLITVKFSSIVAVFVVIVALLNMLLPVLVLADEPTVEDTNAINLDTVNHKRYEDQTADLCSVDSAAPASGTATELLGGDNPEKAFRFFTSKGLTVEQAAGILGNLIWESGVDPQRIQGTPVKRSPDPNSSGSKGWGLMQWTPGSKIVNLAKQAGLSAPIYELGTQLDLVWWHLNNVSPTGRKNVLPGLKAITGPGATESVTRYFEDKMEGAGTPAINERIKKANEALAKYGGSPVAATPASTSTTSGCVTSAGASQFVDGFTVYSQYDPRWKDKAYSTSTIGASGCGPSAMAMIITALSGTPVTPDVTATYAASKGMYVPGAGSSHQIAPELAKNWSLKAEKLDKNMLKIVTALQQGKLVITSGKGGSPFTTGGHYIVIRGITADNKFKIGDSNRADTSTKDWDPVSIFTNMNESSMYAISRQ